MFIVWCRTLGSSCLVDMSEEIGMNEFEMTEEAMQDRDSWPCWILKDDEFAAWTWGELFLIKELDGALTYMSALSVVGQMEEMEVKPGDVLFVRDGSVGLIPKVPFEERERVETDRKVFSKLFESD